MPDLNVYLIIITGETSAQHCELERLGRSNKVHVPAHRARYRHVPIEVPSRSLATSYLTLLTSLDGRVHICAAHVLGLNSLSLPVPPTCTCNLQPVTCNL